MQCSTSHTEETFDDRISRKEEAAKKRWTLNTELVQGDQFEGLRFYLGIKYMVPNSVLRSAIAFARRCSFK